MVPLQEDSPFSLNYARKEIISFPITSYDKRGIRIVQKSIPYGALDQYMTCGGREREEVSFPVFYVDDTLWMSLSLMEIQSMAVPLKLVKGRCATIGLGMGYFTMRAMQKLGVKSMVVFERERRVIEYFKEVFGEERWFRRITFVEGDALETCKGCTFDFLFNDRYESLLSDEVISDAKTIRAENKIGLYRFWGQEKVLWAAIMEQVGRIAATEEDWRFFRHWASTGRVDLYKSIDSVEFVASALEAVG